MSDEQDKHRSEADAELEREIRKGRKFSLGEAIGRLAGPGMMKGASPITRKQQVEVEIEDYLRRELTDTVGALRIVVLRRVKESKHLLSNYDQPLIVLAAYLQSVLDSEYLLRALVRETDIEWGRIVGERPYFDKEGSPPHPADPYTFESVRNTLSGLIEKLTPGDA